MRDRDHHQKNGRLRKYGIIFFVLCSTLSYLLQCVLGYCIIFLKTFEHFYTQPLEESVDHFMDRAWRTNQPSKNFF